MLLYFSVLSVVGWGKSPRARVFPNALSSAFAGRRFSKLTGFRTGCQIFTRRIKYVTASRTAFGFSVRRFLFSRRFLSEKRRSYKKHGVKWPFNGPCRTPYVPFRGVGVFPFSCFSAHISLPARPIPCQAIFLLQTPPCRLLLLLLLLLHKASADLWA